MPDRLVILGSTITALAVARDAHSHGLQPVVVDTGPGIAFRSRWVTPCLLPSHAEDDAILSALGKVRGGPLVATGDPWLRFLLRHRAALEATFTTVLHPDNDRLAICLDKHRFADWCAANDLSAPRGWLAGVQPRPEGLAPPFLIRPAATLHGRPASGLPKAVEALDEEQLAAWLADFAAAGCPALVSESLLGQPLTQYSVPFARNQSELLSFVARKVRPAPRRCAVGTCVELAPEPEVEALARKAAAALDYFGVGEAEVLHSDATGRNHLIEINARPWLQYALAPASGHDFLGLLLGRHIELGRQVKTGRRWIDLRADLFGALSSSVGAVRHGELGLGAYLASIARANVFARFDPRDPGPALYREPGGADAARARVADASHTAG